MRPLPPARSKCKIEITGLKKANKCGVVGAPHKINQDKV
jgi:hypothetical protein